MHDIWIIKLSPFEIIGGGLCMDKRDPDIGFKIAIRFNGCKNILMFDDEDQDFSKFCKNKNIYYQHQHYRCPELGYNPLLTLYGSHPKGGYDSLCPKEWFESEQAITAPQRGYESLYDSH